MQNGDAYANLQESAVRELERLASPGELREAEAAAAMAEYQEWSASGRPGAISHETAKRLLLGESG